MKYLILILAITASGCAPQFVKDNYHVGLLFMPVEKKGSELFVKEKGTWGRVRYTINQEQLKKRVNAVSDETSEKERKTKRNKLLTDLINISDMSCSIHHVGILAREDVWNIGFGSVSTFFSAVGTAVSSVATKTQLAAGATLLNTTQSLVNEEVYANALGLTILKATNLARKNKLAEIGTKLKNDKDDEYTIHQGLSDVLDYHNRCSFYYGLLEISSALDNKKHSKGQIAKAIDTLEKALKKDSADKDRIKAEINSLNIGLVNAPD